MRSKRTSSVKVAMYQETAVLPARRRVSTSVALRVILIGSALALVGYGGLPEPAIAARLAAKVFPLRDGQGGPRGLPFATAFRFRLVPVCVLPDASCAGHLTVRDGSRRVASLRFTPDPEAARGFDIAYVWSCAHTGTLRWTVEIGNARDAGALHVPDCGPARPDPQPRATAEREVRERLAADFERLVDANPGFGDITGSTCAANAARAGRWSCRIRHESLFFRCTSLARITFTRRTGFGGTVRTTTFSRISTNCWAKPGKRL